MNIDFQTLLEGALVLGTIKQIEKYGTDTSILSVKKESGVQETVLAHNKILPDPQQVEKALSAQVVCGVLKKSIRDFTECPDGVQLFEVLHFVSGVFVGQTFTYEYKNF